MPLLEMEHYLVLTDDLEKTKDFYRDALGLKVGFRPNLAFPGYWLYLGDTPCIHIAEWKTYGAYLQARGIPISSKAGGTGPVDHIAFNATNVEEVLTRLRGKGVDVKEDKIADTGLRQLFLTDPNGVKIELNFRPETPLTANA